MRRRLGWGICASRFVASRALGSGVVLADSDLVGAWPGDVFCDPGRRAA